MRILNGLAGIAVSAAFLAPLSALSAPIFIEESATIELPDFAYELRPVAPAVEGDTIVLVGADVRGGEFDDDDIFHAAFLFERRASDGTWQFVSKLLETRQEFKTFQWSDMTVAIEGGRLVVNAEDATAGDIRRVYARGAAGWQPVADVAAPPELEDRGHDSEVDGSTFIVGSSERAYGASAYRRNAQGQWAYIGSATGPPNSIVCSGRCTGADVDISGDTMVFAVPNPAEGEARAEIWNRTGATTWSPVATVPDPQDPVTVRALDAVAIEGNTVLVGARDLSNATFNPIKSTNVLEYARTAAGWNLVDEVRTADAFMNVFDVGAVEFEDGLAVASFPGDDHRGSETGSAAVFRRNSSGRFEEVARLVLSSALTDQHAVGSQFEISGRRVVAIGKPFFFGRTFEAHVFDLPQSFSQPATVQDDFEDANSAGWTPLPGSSWSVPTSGSSRVFRQSSFGALAGAILGSTDWTNQAIEADVKPTAISGADRWVGLAVRYTDGSNYYYVTLRSSNVVELRVMRNGTFAPIASAPQTFTLNRPYRLRLEAIGRWLRVYVDGKLALEAQDHQAFPRGRTVLLTSRARADFDNVIASPNPHLTLLADNFQASAGAFRWSPGLTSDWAVATGDTPGNRIYSQRSTTGDARSVSGVSTRDQIVRVRARADAFDGADRWFGLMTRFRDDQNYYYVTLRNSNQISLRKLVNGSIQQLDTAAMTVSTGTWYDLRMESVGNLHRVYVNGVLRLEASDSTHASGRYGFRTFRAAASYDDFDAMKP